jgi:hypothetical protein
MSVRERERDFWFGFLQPFIRTLLAILCFQLVSLLQQLESFRQGHVSSGTTMLDKQHRQQH